MSWGYKCPASINLWPHTPTIIAVGHMDMFCVQQDLSKQHPTFLPKCPLSVLGRNTHASYFLIYYHFCYVIFLSEGCSWPHRLGLSNQKSICLSSLMTWGCVFFFLRDLDGNGDACIREDIQECLKACRHLTINPHTHSGVDLMNRVFVSLRFPLWGSCVKKKKKCRSKNKFWIRFFYLKPYLDRFL